MSHQAGYGDITGSKFSVGRDQLDQLEIFVGRASKAMGRAETVIMEFQKALPQSLRPLEIYFGTDSFFLQILEDIFTCIPMAQATTFVEPQLFQGSNQKAEECRNIVSITTEPKKANGDNLESSWRFIN